MKTTHKDMHSHVPVHSLETATPSKERTTLLTKMKALYLLRNNLHAAAIVGILHYSRCVIQVSGC